MAVFLEILVNDILPIFIVAGTGFLLARYAQADVRTLSKLTFNACAPCLIVTLLVTSSLGAGDVGRMALFAAAAILCIGIVARAAAAVLRLERQATAAFLLVVMFANAGNFGLSAVAFHGPLVPGLSDRARSNRMRVRSAGESDRPYRLGHPLLTVVKNRADRPI